MTVGGGAASTGERDGVTSAEDLAAGVRLVFTQYRSLTTHVRQQVGGVQVVANLLSQFQGLDEIPLGQRVAAGIGGGPTSERGGLGQRGVQLPSNARRVAAVQRCRDLVVHEAHDMGAHPMRAVRLIHAAQAGDGVLQ
jgi:hypothetical protein